MTDRTLEQKVMELHRRQIKIAECLIAINGALSTVATALPSDEYLRVGKPISESFSKINELLEMLGDEL